MSNDGAASPHRSEQPQLWKLSPHSLEECRQAWEANIPRFQARRAMEREIQEQLHAREQAILPGYCWVCRDVRAFTYDLRYSDGKCVNWRERIVCPTCRLNNRLRLSVQIFERMVEDATPSIYLTEQVTPLASYISTRFPSTIMSEFLGTEFSPGHINAGGVRHENVTSLSFEDESFDYILSFDVLEHVPNYRAALAELSRVLKQNGQILISVPFGLLTDRNIVRARMNAEGHIEHLLPPEYHGNPVDPNGGILCYYHFGWEFLEELHKVGFSDAYVLIAWSLEFGHIGQEQVLIVGQK
jgi:SAM-dependent methyltransferase